MEIRQLFINIWHQSHLPFFLRFQRTREKIKDVWIKNFEFKSDELADNEIANAVLNITTDNVSNRLKE